MKQALRLQEVEEDPFSYKNIINFFNLSIFCLFEFERKISQAKEFSTADIFCLGIKLSLSCSSFVYFSQCITSSECSYWTVHPILSLLFEVQKAAGSNLPCKETSINGTLDATLDCQLSGCVASLFSLCERRIIANWEIWSNINLVGGEEALTAYNGYGNETIFNWIDKYVSVWNLWFTLFWFRLKTRVMRKEIILLIFLNSNLILKLNNVNKLIATQGQFKKHTIFSMKNRRISLSNIMCRTKKGFDLN